ncbi:carbohydrate sulfotransferase 11-like isoform X2 [Penaeus chinensis]|uniref:carbohydrate sulfotransferase 11-like isoform X2 n=1 Tax=Penaeus chinensis TaxID=139456 RepID=UPI001FB5A213|nr:carbohydrate sulfotransferase 11-like isoform X2 [Penaeus chinensis]
MWSRTRKFIYFSILFLAVAVGMVYLRGKYPEAPSFLAEIRVVEGEAAGDQKRVEGTTDRGENEDLERRGDDAGESEYKDAYDSEHGDGDEGTLGDKDEGNAGKQTSQTKEGYEGQEEPRHFETEKRSGDEEEATGEGLLELFRRRRERVRAACEERRNNSAEKENVEVTLKRQILHFWGWNVSVCTIPKVGSGTWRGHVNRINGRSGDPLRDPKRRNVTRGPVRDALGQVRKTVRIMTVRHPLTRLVSAYRNKFRDGKRFGVHHKIGRRTFLVPALKHLPQKRQTFSYLCSPCHLDYDYVTKLETQTEELHHVFGVVGLPADPARQANPIKKGEDKDASDLAYYKQVPLSLKKEIYDVFKFDMMMFDYQLPNDFWETTYYKQVPLSLKKEIYDVFKFDMMMFDYQLPNDFWETT